MNDRLDEVHYCKCGHMLTNHHLSEFTDENGVRISFYPCNYHSCNCLQYERKFTLYYKEIFEVNDG